MIDISYLEEAVDKLPQVPGAAGESEHSLAVSLAVGAPLALVHVSFVVLNLVLTCHTPSQSLNLVSCPDVHAPPTSDSVHQFAFRTKNL